jgi:hypothetical protein
LFDDCLSADRAYAVWLLLLTRNWCSDQNKHRAFLSAHPSTFHRFPGEACRNVDRIAAEVEAESVEIAIVRGYR